MTRFKLQRGRSGRPPLSIPQIVYWADEWFQQHGEWPQVGSGWIPGTDEKWANVHRCLVNGQRGLPGGTTLEKLLSDLRGGMRSRKMPPALTEPLILLWADAHHQRKGQWPTSESGGIARTRDETWRAVDAALRGGLRGLSGGSSLAKLLDVERGVRNLGNLPALSESLILAWADTHHEVHGAWPTAKSGAITGTSDETWKGIDGALRFGRRGLAGDSSLPRLLAAHRGVRNHRGSHNFGDSFERLDDDQFV